VERLSEQELDELVETIVARSLPTPRADRRLARALGEAPPHRVEFEGGAVTAWRIGEGPALLLAHGAFDDHLLWNPLMAAAAARGHSIVTLDMPGSGHSAETDRGGDRGMLALLAVAEALGPVDTVIGHSIGAVSAVQALDAGLAARKAVLIASALPTRWDLWILDRPLVAPEGAPAIALERAAQRLDAMRTGPQFDFPVERAVSRLDLPALLVHSRDDPHWSWRASEAIAEAWPGARAYYPEGLGHRDVARDAGVIEAVLDFVEA
jgi:pimeloyl-ACP methyl ester carboxylesterase